MKQAIATGAVIAALAAAYLWHVPSPNDEQLPVPAAVAPDNNATQMKNDTPKADGDAAAPPLDMLKPTVGEPVAANPADGNELHTAVPASEPRTDAIVPPVKRAKPKDPVLAGDPADDFKKGSKKPAKSEAVKGSARP